MLIQTGDTLYWASTPTQVAAASYKRVAPKPKGKWKLQPSYNRKVTVRRDLKTSGQVYLISLLGGKAGAKGGAAAVAAAGAVVGLHLPKGADYLAIKSYTRSNSYVMQYKTTIRYYSDSKHKHYKRSASRTTSFVKKYKLVRVR